MIFGTSKEREAWYAEILKGYDFTASALNEFDLNWLDNYYLLTKFKDEQGHCNVPQMYSENISLGRWVIRQRARKQFLPQYRIELLNNIGFVWDIFEHAWHQNFKRLKAFKKKYGHCDVSKRQPYVALAEWVVKQRRDFKNKEARLSDNKISLLNSIGFNWQLIVRTDWFERFKQLKEYKNNTGHCKVPGKWKPNTPLANWVSIQRRDKYKLDKEKIRLLNSIGFTWATRTNKKRGNKT